MKRVFISLAVLAISAIFCVYYLYEQSTIMDSYRLNHQIDQIIGDKKVDQIKKVAADKETYSFLMNLPEDTRPLHTSDNQGSNGKTEYYVTVIEGKTADVTLKQTLMYGGLFRKVKVRQISLQ